MRATWRITVASLLLGFWPMLGCHQLPSGKSAQDLRPIEQKSGRDPRQDLTVADIVQTEIAKAEKLEKAGKLEDAVALYEKMRQPGNPNAMQATRKLAHAYLRHDDLYRAEQEFHLLAQQNPGDADAIYHLGEISCRRGHWAPAELCLIHALKLNPNHVQARTSLAAALAQQGRYAESYEEFARLVSRAEAHCEVAFVMKLQGKHQEALGAYQKALGIDPTMQRALHEMAHLRQRMLTEPTPIVAKTPAGKTAVVELEAAANQVAVGTGRQVMQHPTLPPVPFDAANDRDWTSSGKKR